MGVSETTRIGSVLAGYRIESLLGRGGMSVVYLAEHVRLGRKVALKVLAAPLANDDNFRERFVRESQRAAELDHPNVIPIYDAGEVEGGDADGLLYIAMRYVAGSDLRSLLKQQRRLSLGRTLFVLEQVAGALDVAHDHSLIHRDVKPANILIAEPSEHVYLTDFGVAKQTTAPELTRTGVFIGTVDYAAPEQIEGLALDGRTDVYALGCVLYECLAGRPPFDREAEVAVMHAHLITPPPKLTDARPDLPKTLDRVIASAMAKSMGDRFATCPALVDAAREAVLQRRPTSARPLAELEELELLEPEPIARSSEQPLVTSPEPEPSVVAPAVPEPAAAQPAPAAPPAPPLSEPVAATPAAERVSRRPPPRWLITAILVVVAAAASGAVAYLVARDGSEPTTSATPPPGTTTAQKPQTSGLPTLASLVPNPLWKECAVQNVARAGAVQSAVCLPSGDLSVANSPDRWEVSIFPSKSSLATAYGAARQQAGVKSEGGRCDGSLWAGSGPWAHAPGKPGGERFCYFDGDDAVMVWTHEKLGQPNHRDLLAVAREGGTDHAGLFSWWRFWHHRIGKAGS
jgi:serine/threonine protein kinase